MFRCGLCMSCMEPTIHGTHLHQNYQGTYHSPPYIIFGPFVTPQHLNCLFPTLRFPVDALRACGQCSDIANRHRPQQGHQTGGLVCSPPLQFLPDFSTPCVVEFFLFPFIPSDMFHLVRSVGIRQESCEVLMGEMGKIRKIISDFFW